MVRSFYNLSKHKVQYSTLLVLVTIWIIFLIGSPRTFLSFPIYSSFMSTIPASAIMALALTFVIITSEIDLSFPSIMGFSGWVFIAVYINSGNIYLALLVCLVTGIIAGFLNGIIVTKLRIPSLVATIGTMFFWRGLTMICAAGKGESIVSSKNTLLHSIMVGRIGGYIPAQVVWAIFIAGILGIVLNRHKLGAHVFYSGDNINSAKMMGVNINKTKIFVFSMLGFFAAFAAVVACLEITYFYPSLGEGYLLKTIAAVFLGGTSAFGGVGTIFGTFIGALIIGCIEAGIVAIGISGFWTQLIYGLIIIISITITSKIKKK